MVGSSRLVAAVAASILLSAASAQAFCGYVWYPGTVTYSYFAPSVYYAGPVWSSPVYPLYELPYCPIEPAIRVTPLAKPQPAPPSTAPTSKEPPLGNNPIPYPNRMSPPKITETHSKGGSYETVVLPRCKVGFWNLTGKDITVKVEGKDQTLPKDRAVTIELDRQFSWQAPGRDIIMERVPEDQNAYEVVIRPNID